MARRFDTELYTRPDGAIWLQHELWELDDRALRAGLRVPEHELLSEALSLQVDKARVAARFGQPRRQSVSALVQLQLEHAREMPNRVTARASS